MKKTLSWNPVRRGRIYCASGCGGNCTWKAYTTAKTESAKLAKRLDKKWTIRKGWTTRVWENLGWHYKVISPCGRVKVHKAYGEDYTAFLGDKDSSGGRWVESAKTPEAAIRRVFAKAKRDLAKMGAMIEGL